MYFHNTFINLPKDFYSLSRPAHFANPQLIKFNLELSQSLGLDLSSKTNEELAKIFVGETLLEGSEPISLAYAAHQFGHFVDQLGDGRAILLGEILDPKGKRFDIQLKGAGQTKYSRNGDGRSALGPVIREYILSEAMNHLGVPTTRALAAVLTGEDVYRETAIPGAVFTRVASSHIRIGTFQYFAARNDKNSLNELLHYCINRHYPEIKNSENLALNFLRKVAENQIKLVSHWMSLGFIHGVMNTDNMTISGETIDYGPCAFMDHFNFNQVFSFIDRNARYSYNNQPKIVVWNLSRLADCLIPLMGTDEESAIKLLNQELTLLSAFIEREINQRMSEKMGFSFESGDEKILKAWFEYLQTENLDFTLSFRHLSNLVEGNESTFFKPTPLFEEFRLLWRNRIKKSSSLKVKMDLINPLFIPRNHQVESAIQKAIKGDFSTFNDLNKVLARPFDDQPAFKNFSEAPTPNQKIKNTFCGT